MTLPPGTRLGPYEVLTILGHGGFGEVYRARDPRLGREVAIKTIRGPRTPEQIRRLEIEARAAAALNHPNIVAVLDVGVSDDVPYVVTELLDGETLRAVLTRERLELPRAIAYATQIVAALEVAHGKGIVHRDLKPENVFVLPDGRIKVVDFGLAKLVAADDAVASAVETAPALTAKGDVLGTPAYLAPEQARGSAVDHRADIFSFGIVLYEMVTGWRPFAGQTAAEVLAGILRDPVPPLSGDGAALSALDLVLQRCLAKDPRARFQSARDLGFALMTLPVAARIQAGGPDAGAARPGGRRRRPSSRTFAIAAIAIAVVVTAAVVGSKWSRRGFEDSQTPNSGVTSEPVISPRARETVAVSAATVSKLRVVANRVAGLFDRGDPITVIRIDDTHLEVAGPQDKVASAVSALRLADALATVRFFDEPGVRLASSGVAPLFTGSGQSKTRVGLSVRAVRIDALLQLIAGSAGWPVVLDETVRGVVTLELNDVPWDLLVRSCLELQGPELTTVRMGDVWLVSSRARIAEVTRERLALWITRSRTVSARNLARVFEPARTERGVIVVNDRLDAVVIVDLFDAFPAYSRILSAIDKVRLESIEFPRLRERFAGAPVNADISRVGVEDAIKVLGRIAGLNVVLEPRAAVDGARPPYGAVSAVLANTRWDNTLQVMLTAAGLVYTINGNLLHLMPKESPSNALVVETIPLQREMPAFFHAFTPYLSPQGAMSEEQSRRLLVIRDVPWNLVVLTKWVKEIDGRSR